MTDLRQSLGGNDGGPDLPQQEELEKQKGWDLFEINEPDDNADSFVDGTCYQVILQTLKILVYIVTFVVVLGGAIMAKTSLLLITSQLRPAKQIDNCDGTFRNSTGNPSLRFLIPVEEKVYWSWIIVFMFWIPEIFTFFRSLRICVFKGQHKPTWVQFIALFSFETLHTIGVGLFVFIALPALDIVKGAVLMSTVCIVPAILALLSREKTRLLNVSRSVDGVAFLLQFSALFLWILFPEQDMPSVENLWILPISIFLISFGWWENYIEPEAALSFMEKLKNLKQELLTSGYFSYLFISVWKMILFFVVMVGTFEMKWGNSGDVFNKATGAFAFRVDNTRNSSFPIDLGRTNGLDIGQHPLLYQVLGAFLCYIFGKYACKICIQHFSFALPITLAVPLTIGVLVMFCNNDVCLMKNPFYGDLIWTCPAGDYFTHNHAWMWILWFISQTWITVHIWFPPHGERLAKSEVIFNSPFYSAILIDQSLALNRKRKNEDEKMDNLFTFKRTSANPGLKGNNNSAFEDEHMYHQNQGDTDDKRLDSVPKIFACATMWHENREEMIEILKSIFRMDADQCSRRIASTMTNNTSSELKQIGYYEYETHIFFDDAFRLSDVNDYKSPMVVNDFVKLFIDCVEEATQRIHQDVYLRPPQKIPTPYGGRMEWLLPGETRMICHLKDKSKIRHRKRWSQVMYMYYFLGNRLMDRSIDLKRKDVIAQNTFLLALDGDVDFKPKAVELLVDLMRKNPKLGAACGRIHPTGGGPMVWYQKFEYATGHWFQKATEHVLGAVLCSPGCFSLFRGKALMSPNVMAKYTTNSDEALHYVQYDQGEDRWLCTLLLQQGYRVDYSAASDAYTHAPEDFNEFYNQRRRWVPSTTANILDLLLDYKQTIKLNPDISIFYILYQFMLMFGAIMGPGTIFLMLVGAFTAVFGLSSWTSFALNMVPILIFSLTCYFQKSDVQLKLAQILSVIYALIMVGVIVGIAVNATQEGILAPSSIFLVAVASSFIITAMLHPLEFDCLFHGLLYFITIPSMYLLLIIFSVFNLNNVSWGTREGPKIKSKQELLAEAKAQAEMKKKQQNSGFFAAFLSDGKDDAEGSFEFSFAGIFKLMCCTHKKEDKDAKLAASLDALSKKLDQVEKKLDNPSGGPATSSASNRRTRFLDRSGSGGLDALAESEDEEEETNVERIPEDPKNPQWMKDLSPADAVDVPLRRGNIALSESEITFWNELIAKYLYPIDADPEKEKKLVNELRELRDKCVFYFFFLNSIFVLLIFLLELEKDTLSIDWPFGEKDLKLEPIATVFLIFFALIMLVQFLAMLVHRMGTLSHILASLDLFFMKWIFPKGKDEMFARNQVGLIKQIQSLNKIEPDKKKPKVDDIHKDDIINLGRKTLKPKSFDNNLEHRFTKNMEALGKLNPTRQSQIVGNAFGKQNPEKNLKALTRLTTNFSRVSMLGGNRQTENPIPRNRIQLNTEGRMVDSNV